MLPAFAEHLFPVDLGDAKRDLFVTQSQSIPAQVTVICVHGWTLDHRSFVAQRALADRGVRLVRYDRRGFGHSALAPNFQRELDDLDFLVSHFDTPVVLYGVSQGARLALRYAVLGKQPLAGLILQGGHVDGLAVDESPGEAIPFDTYRSWLAQGDLARFRQHWMQHPLVCKGMGTLTSQEILSLIDTYRGADLLIDDALPVSMDLRPEIDGLTLPILTVVGSLETASRKAHARAIQSLTGAEELTVPGGGHLCNVSHSQQVNDGISAWCDVLNVDTTWRDSRARG